MSAAAIVNPEEYLQKKAKSFRRDPFGYTKYFFRWGKDTLSDSQGPRTWQADILNLIGTHLQSPATRFSPLRIAVASGHGIGKSCLISFIIQWAMSTMADCKVLVTANTGTQLATKTVPEVSKWFYYAINKHWFEIKAQSITCRAPEHHAIWRTDFIPWSARNTEAFQGLHNKNKRIVLIFDEASGIDPLVWDAASGALTDENTEIIWIAFGNPTRNTGRFRECFGSRAHRWNTFQIDSRTVPGTNKEEIEQWRKDWGEDSDYFRVKVRGEFPRAGDLQFIPSDIVAAARKYHAESYAGLPKYLACDVARFGDDQTVVGLRQGRKFQILARYRGLDTVQVAERLIEFKERENPEALIVDGDNMGAGVVDQIKFRGFGKGLFEFHGGEKANDTAAHFNKSVECWSLMRQWLVAGAEIPDDPDLETSLTERQYGINNKSQIQLEKKEDMKARGLKSPDDADTLSMTFAVKVAAPAREEPMRYVVPGQDSGAWMS